MVGATKDQLLADFGTVIAGARAEGCETVVAMAKEAGGRPEATILVHGGKVPAQQAAFVNARDGAGPRLSVTPAVPGAHPGTAIIIGRTGGGGTRPAA